VSAVESYHPTIRLLRFHPDLNLANDHINYFERSANAYVEPKKDSYFDNDTILKQFERLFKLLKFKKEFAGHSFEILVDHATTHSAIQYDVNLLGKKPGTVCPYKTIEWMEGVR
jgi:hypothetical protein